MPISAAKAAAQSSLRSIFKTAMQNWYPLFLFGVVGSMRIERILTTSLWNAKTKNKKQKTKTNIKPSLVCM